MRIAAMMMVLALAACARQEPAAPVFRDTARPIASAALFDWARFAGDWRVVARYPLAAEAGCAGGIVTYGAGSIDWQCLGPAGEILSQRQGAASPAALPGRLSVDLGPGYPAELWVLWVDFDYRTVVIGTPDGRGGWVLDRSEAIPADRMAAAREMLDFNGYDLGALVTTR
jgi:apolipoprotein D and lipocalin family protein